MALTKASYSMITGAQINVLDYGADPTGVTDSSSAIQTALDYAYANTLSLYIPSGTYLVNTQVEAGDGVLRDIIIQGNNSILKTTNTTIQGILYLHGNGPSNRGGRVIIQGVYFQGAAKADANIGLKLEDLQGINIQNCRFSYVGKGIYTYNVDIATIANKNYVSFCGTGIECDGPSGGQANGFGIQGNLINQCDIGIEYRGGIGANICFNEIDNNGIHVRIGFGASAYDAYGTTISYNKLESTESSMSATPTAIWLGGSAGIATSPLVEHNAILSGDTEVTFRVANIQGNGRIKNNIVALADPLFTSTLITQTSSVVKAVFSEADLMPNGTVTFGAADATKTITLAVAEPNTSYNVLLTNNGVSGTPASGAFVVTDLQKTTSNFLVRIQAVPGVGASVTYTWSITR